MNAYTLARVVHVLSIVLWIGGVAFVTMVLLPSVRQIKRPEERMPFFEEVEGRFAVQSRVTTVVAGLSGLYMLYALNAWSWFYDSSRWYLHAMVLVWTLFTVMLFVLEPLVLHRWFHHRATTDPVGTFQIVQRMHWVLLILSLITTAGAVAGAHGWLV